MDDTMIVLTEGVGGLRHHRAIEFNIDLELGEWFRINEFNIDGRSSDVDISRRIAVIRGVDSHRVIFHSIWKGFRVLYFIIHTHSLLKLRNSYLLLS
jgi:hypothetical protein